MFLKNPAPEIRGASAGVLRRNGVHVTISFDIPITIYNGLVTSIEKYKVWRGIKEPPNQRPTT
jgi:hypothetical protein